MHSTNIKTILSSFLPKRKKNISRHYPIFLFSKCCLIWISVTSSILACYETAQSGRHVSEPSWNVLPFILMVDETYPPTQGGITQKPKTGKVTAM